MDKKRLLSLRMARQGFTAPVSRADYDALYRDLQPGRCVYWNGFGQPPTLAPRPDFDDLEYNRLRQRDHNLLKVRAAGNLGWIDADDLPLFAALYQKPLDVMTPAQEKLLTLLHRTGPLNIQQIKEETGWLVKEITPILHRLQEAYLLYEDQYDGEWDREWYPIEEMFPALDSQKPERETALETLLGRFAFRMAAFTLDEARAFLRLPVREIRAALQRMTGRGVLHEEDALFMLSEDVALLPETDPEIAPFVCLIHRNDPLYRACEPAIKAMIEPCTADLPYDCEPLEYILMDGRFVGAVVGHFRNGPYDLNDVVGICPLDSRREEILSLVRAMNFGKMPVRFESQPL